MDDGANDPVPLNLAHLVQRLSGPAYAGIANQRIERAVVTHRLPDEFPHFDILTHVGGNKPRLAADLLNEGDCFIPFRNRSDSDDRCSFGREQAGDDAAVASAAPVTTATLPSNSIMRSLSCDRGRNLPVAGR
jgi:hypothetical protein